MRELRNLSNDVTVSKVTVNCCIQRDNLVLYSSNGGKQSLLAKYKPYFIEMIIKLAYYHYSIICAEGLELINSLIQKKKFKMRLFSGKYKIYVSIILLKWIEKLAKNTREDSKKQMII